jgi:hypothetical protein
MPQHGRIMGDDRDRHVVVDAESADDAGRLVIAHGKSG